MSIKTNYNEFKLCASFKGDKVAPWGNNTNRHIVTVFSNDTGRKTSFDYWSPEIKTEDDILEGFYCFCSDALAGTYTFEGFCDMYGYDYDSRNAEKIYKLCKNAFNKFWRLTGYSADMLCDLVNNLSDKVNN